MTIPSVLASALSDRYEVLRELGAGGMATVYLAHDVRHDRDVAIKVLHPDLGAALGADRFLAEIKTTAKLQHPHILTLLDSGSADGMLYYVMPVVTGESLRDRLQRERQLPIADAVRIAREVAGALDYAHRHGVIHRDIKPENILLHDGSAIVADFGIALAVQSASGPRMTQTGLSLGTPQYMSPEQAMGERNIDARADIYALGAVAYEMLTADPPFTGSSVQAIVARVMTERPTPPHVIRDTVPPHVEHAVLRALEKLPADRFASAAEFSAALDDRAAAIVASSAGHPMVRARTITPRTMVAAGLVTAGVFIAGVILGRTGSRGGAGGARYTQKTFDQDPVQAARFAPDGKTLVIATGRGDIRVIRPDYPEAQSVGITRAKLFGVSSQGELAVGLRLGGTNCGSYGTLSRVPLGGGAPRELVDSVSDAAWTLDGSQLAIVRARDGKFRIEFPIGKTLLESAGCITELRMAPDGQHLAFLDQPIMGDTRGTVGIIDLTGRKTTLTPDFSGVYGLAWSPDSKDLYFSSRRNTHQNVVFAVSTGKRLREALNGAGDLRILDVGANGQWLVARNATTLRAVVHDAADSLAHAVGWQDWIFALALTGDGKQLAMSEAGGEAGQDYDLWLRAGGAQRLARIGHGSVGGFSRDGKWVLSTVPTTPASLMLYPTGAGAERRIPTAGFDAIDHAEWIPGNDSVLVCGHQGSSASHCVIQSVGGQGQRGVSATPRTLWLVAAVAPNGQSMIGGNAGHDIAVVSLTGGATKVVPGTGRDDMPVRWSPDGHAIWIVRYSDHALQSVDVTTGARTTLIKSVAPVERSSSTDFPQFVMSDDARTYAYIVGRTASDLFVVDGAR